MDIKHNPVVQKIFTSIFSWLNAIIPKKKQIVLYSNWGFRDNVFYLYKFMIEHNYNEKIKIICISNDLMGINRDSNYKNVVFIESKLKMVWFYLTSKYFVYCFGGVPIKPAKKQIVLNLWHGMPIKRIGRMEVGFDNRKINNFTYLLSYSPFFNDILKESFDIVDDQILVANAPRNKQLLEKKERFSKDFKSIAWLPTYRTSKKLNSKNGSQSFVVPIIKDINNLRELDNFLDDNQVCLFIKLHPLQDINQLDDLEKLKNIRFIDEQWLLDRNLDLYQFLAKTDALISDYSSVTIDYLLTDNPIYYIFDDLEKYKNSRGLNYRISEFTAGKIIDNFKDLTDSIVEIKKGIDDYKGLRNEIRDKFYLNKERNSEFILKKLNI